MHQRCDAFAILFPFTVNNLNAESKEFALISSINALMIEVNFELAKFLHIKE
jgi:hypothetical protein